MAVTQWLADKSALVRLGQSPDAVTWAERIERGLVRVTSMTRLEVGYSARSWDDARVMLTRPPVSSMPVEYLTPTVEDRAVQVQLLLAREGHHRAPSIPDLVIAALTGQPLERLNAQHLTPVPRSCSRARRWCRQSSESRESHSQVGNRHRALPARLRHGTGIACPSRVLRQPAVD